MSTQEYREFVDMLDELAQQPPPRWRVLQLLHSLCGGHTVEGCVAMLNKRYGARGLRFSVHTATDPAGERSPIPTVAVLVTVTRAEQRCSFDDGAELVVPQPVHCPVPVLLAEPYTGASPS